MVLGLATIFHSQELGREFIVLNLYGPYAESVSYWEKLFWIDLIKQNALIVGGELNFSLGRKEI